ncbi:MAG: CoA transferase [bacterium]|nr:hypothetical protein [Gammaproteobacteria bacterium]HIL98490.1 hypothetical protein [Pseudomonadales bacterium]
MKGIFSGLRVVELSADVAGSFAGQICADRGAEVIKVEPMNGDPLRNTNAFAVSESKLFQSLNRGKQSVTLDIYTQQGLELASALIQTADVVLVSLQKNRFPGKLGYESVRIENPGLIYLDINAFGEQGFWAEKPANDLVLQAYSGMLLSEGKTASDGKTPVPLVSTQMSEYATALYAIVGISSALFHRVETGIGQKVTTSKLLTLLSLQSSRVVNHDMADKPLHKARKVLSLLRAEGASHEKVLARRKQLTPRLVPAFYRPYQTSDGAVFVGALTRRLRDKAREALNTTLQLRDDPDYDIENDEYYQTVLQQQVEIEANLKSKTTAEWIKILESHGVPTGEINFPEDLHESPQLIENNYLGEIDHPSGKQIHVMPHARFSAAPVPDSGLKGAPALGRDTEAVIDSLG